MWRWIRELAYAGRLPRDWGYCEVNAAILEEDAATTPSPLDPVEVAGATRLNGLRTKMEQIKATIIAEAMGIIDVRVSDLGRAVLKQLQKTTAHTRRAPCDTKYRDHFKELQEYGLIERAKAEDAHRSFHSTYFAVAKEEPSGTWPRGTSRSIFNGRKLSDHMEAPPPVNIASTRDLVERMIRHGQQHGKYYVYSGDLRHWFHQLTLREDMRRFFTLIMDKEAYVWTRLPMGWSYSPFIAQCCAWSLFLVREPTECALLDEAAFQGGQLPTFVSLLDGDGHEVGFITIYYDNFLVVANQPQMVAQVKARLTRTCREAGTVIKKGSEVERSHPQFLQTPFAHVGVGFQASADGPKGSLMWWPSKQERWCLTYSATYSPGTIRECAEWLGRILFATLLSGRPLGGDANSRKTRAALSLLGRRAHVAQNWDALLTKADEKLVKLCQEAWTGVTRLVPGQEPYRCDLSAPSVEHRPLEQIQWLLATDASKHTGAWIPFTRSGNQWIVEEEIAGKMRLSRDVHIYEKEMESAVQGIQCFFKYHSDVKRLFVVVDNSAVAWALEKGFTTHEEGNNILSRVDEWLDRIAVVLVISEDNPADCPTRNNDGSFAPRVERMTKAVAGYIAGARWASKTPKEWRPDPTSTPGLRHGPPREPPTKEETDPKRYRSE